MVKKIRRATRKHYYVEEKIRIVLEGLQGEDSIAELCRREGLGSNVYYRWSKDFLEVGKKRLAGDVIRTPFVIGRWGQALFKVLARGMLLFVIGALVVT